jgi:hypothetical protein
MNAMTTTMPPNDEYIIKFVTLENGFAKKIQEWGSNLVFSTSNARLRVFNARSRTYFKFQNSLIEGLLNPQSRVC